MRRSHWSQRPRPHAQWLILRTFRAESSIGSTATLYVANLHIAEIKGSIDPVAMTLFRRADKRITPPPATDGGSLRESQRGGDDECDAVEYVESAAVLRARLD